MNDDLARFAAGRRLKTNTQPTVRFVVLLETSGRNGVRENKKCALVSKLFFQALQQKVVLVVEHCVQAHPTHVTIGRSVDRVAEGHVVSRHRFCNRPGGAADVKKSARYFLPRADFGERSVLRPIEIDLERLTVRPDVHLRLHAATVEAAVLSGNGRGRF